MMCDEQTKMTDLNILNKTSPCALGQLAGWRFWCFGVCGGRGGGGECSGLIISPAVVVFLTISPDYWREPCQVKLQPSKRVTEFLSLTAGVRCVWSLAPEILKSTAVTETRLHTVLPCLPDALLGRSVQAEGRARICSPSSAWSIFTLSPSLMMEML